MSEDKDLEKLEKAWNEYKSTIAQHCFIPEIEKLFHATFIAGTVAGVGVVREIMAEMKP